MKKPEWEPGPWVVRYDYNGPKWVYSELTDNVVCDLVDLETEEANANLIATAPELYGALEQILDGINKAKKALAKARGEEE